MKVLEQLGVMKELLVWLWALSTGVAAVAAPEAAGAVRLWQRGDSLLYAVESVTQLTEAARRDAEVGWRISARLAVRAAACSPSTDEALLVFELQDPELQLRGAAREAQWAARPSAWAAPALRRAAFAAHWRAGRLLALLLPRADPPHAADYKRALASLFQFQFLDSERNETDATGDCDVLYETLTAHDFRKIKRSCSWAGADAAAAGVESRRVTRYTWREELDALAAVHAEELHELRAADAASDDAGVKARGWTRLTLLRADAAPRCEPAEPGLAAPLAALRADLHAVELPLAPPEPDVSDDEDEWGDDSEFAEAADADGPPADPLEALAALGGAGGGAGTEAAGAGGDEAHAAALLRALPALRAAPPARLAALLRRARDTPTLVWWARALGAAGSAAAHEAMASLEAEGGGAGGAALAAYLGALGAARRPAPAAVRGALRLAGEARAAPVRLAALLAAAGAAPRAHLALELRDELARRLARCKEDECRAAVLTAMGNLRRADTAEPLLAHAERGAPAPALAALRALALAPPDALPPALVARLLDLALNGSRSLEARAAALELGVRRSAGLPFALSAAARRLAASGAPGAPELRRLLWQRLRQLGAARAAVAAFLRAAAADPQLGSWDARAHAGTSQVLRRRTGWAAGRWRAELDSAQLAEGGVLRRGVVALSVRDADEDPSAEPLSALQLELWTRGLAALAGAGSDAASDAGDEPPAAGLQLTVAGAALPPITLFTGQSELVSHVWAGTGSAPTPVLRAALELSERRAAVPLPTGAAATLRARAGAALALDARATVSLWSRTASARLELRAAAAAAARASLAAPWGRARVAARASGAGSLRIAADLDFYDAVALCVRVHCPEHALARRAALRSELGARRWRVRRLRSLSSRRPARSLALGTLNDAACRALPVAHADDD